MNKKKFSHFVVQSLFSAFLIFGVSGCGDQCSFLNRAFSEPACTALKLDASNVPLPLNAACVGATNSRKVRINCPASSGTSSQCTSPSDGFPVYVVIVPNNANGNFQDGNGTLYTTCGQLFGDIFSTTVQVQNIAGIYVSSPSGADKLVCTASGCTLPNAATCVAGWDATLNPPAPSKTAANLPGGAAHPYLVCAYIDNSSLLNPPAPASYGTFASPMTPLVITTNNLHFNSGWVDAF